MPSQIRNCFLCLLLAALLSCNRNPGRTTQERIDYVMQQAYRSHKFVGSILVADSGEVVYKKSFGKADVEKNFRNSDTTKFLLASISKPITAIIILRLVDKGLIKPEDPVSTFFTIENPAVGKITVHQLLTHSSGIDEFISKEKNLNLKTALNKVALKFPPGSNFEYSNSAFVLLIKIAEQVTGKKYDEIVKTEVFEPANMDQSGVARDTVSSIFAKGYKDALQEETADIDFLFKNVDGAGSLYSTAGDLYKLDTALRNKNLLTETTKSLMLQQHLPGRCGYGWFIRERGGVWDVYWCKGNLPGVTTYMSRRVQKNQLIVLLANAGDLDISSIEEDIAKILKARQ